MASVPHVIYRQQLRLHLTDSAAGLAQQRQAEQALQAPALLAALAGVLDEALRPLPPGYWLTIDQLTLNAGILASQDLAGQLLTQLPDLLRRALAAPLPAAAGTPPPARDGGQGPATASIAATSRSWQEPQPVSLLTAAGSTQAPGLATEAAWLFFLATGSLPPHWPAPASLSRWEAELRQVLRTPSPRMASALQQTLRSATARYRLLRQFTPALAAAALVALLPAGQVRATPLTHVLAALLGRSRPHGTADAAGETIALALVEQAASQTVQLCWQDLLAPLPAHLAGHDTPESWALTLALRLASMLPRPEPSLAKVVQRTPEQVTATPTPVSAAIGSALPARTPPPLTSLAPGTDALDSAEYVTNAGVVLLHPFLPACFASCGWLRPDNQFVSPEAQAEAVLLIHYLATGRGQAAEYALQLPRLLCGIPAGAPPPSYHLKLSRKTRAEGRALLRAALTHWSALRGTTAAGLRSAFLQREGKLERLTNGPTLTIAQLPQDVLLDRLPYGWGVSVARLPWLAQHLTINWG